MVLQCVQHCLLTTMYISTRDIMIPHFSALRFPQHLARFLSLQDPQYMTQALTNALLMDAVVGCLQTQRSIIAASKLAYFDKVKHEGRGSLLFFLLLSFHTYMKL